MSGCQARSDRAQQHHFACCLVAFCILERKRHDRQLSIYQLKRQLSFKGRSLALPALRAAARCCVTPVIKGLGLIDMINARLMPDKHEVLTAGEAVAGMILNGLGFANRPMSLTPQLFANKPLDLLFRDGIRADMFNRFKLGRILDEAYAYGGDLLFQELALAVCVQEDIDLRCNDLDTTSLALSGGYVPDSDAQAIRITSDDRSNHPQMIQALDANRFHPRLLPCIALRSLGLQ